MNTIIHSGQTIVHPFGLAILLLTIVVVLFAKRDKVILAVLFMLVSIPSAQRILIMSLDFSFIRILLLFVLLRILSRKENKHVLFGKPDKILFIWMVWSIFAYGMLYGEISAFISRTGYMIDAVGAYIVGRTYIRSWEDLHKVIIFLSYASVLVAVFFIIERMTGKNMFSIFGGVPEYTMIRNDRLRCQGPFSHPIMAGLFWATFLPWIGAAWFSHSINRKLLIIATISMLLIVGNSASSTPVMAILIGGFGLYMYRAKRILPLYRWGIIFLLFSLHLVMEKPVWHLIARIDLAGGSTGWHRYYLIEKSIDYFNEWWLVGTVSTAHWGHGLFDVTNQYILEGVRSGFLGMLLFVFFLLSVFKKTGLAIKSTTSAKETWLLWGGGVALFVHSISFISVSYFGQIVSYFYMFIGILVSLSDHVLQRKRDTYKNDYGSKIV